MHSFYHKMKLKQEKASFVLMEQSIKLPITLQTSTDIDICIKTFKSSKIFFLPHSYCKEINGIFELVLYLENRYFFL